MASGGVDEEGPVLHGEQVIASKGKDARIVHCSSRIVPVVITQEKVGEASVPCERCMLVDSS